VSVLANECQVLYVSVDPSATGIASWDFKLYGTTAYSTAVLLYDLNTTGDTGYSAGGTVRDPNAGYMVLCHYVDGSSEKELHWKLNNSSTTASAFTFSVDYLPLR
jgi:hypothetical protein